MSKWTLALALSAALLVGCSKDDKILEFVKAHDALVADVEKASDADAAQKAFDAKKGELRTLFDGIKGAMGFQVKEETKKKLTDSVVAGATKVCGLQLKALADKPKREKYKKLCDDYTSTFKM